ncbi:MAG: Tir chaperone protein (CesT) family [Solimicrobium sp.]|jgi:hypothetical protein|nr:Tir chaperone protein (CesT) family [Solimicrobium sp.]
MRASLLKVPAMLSDKVSAANSIKIFEARLLDLSHHLGLKECLYNEFNVCSVMLEEEHCIHISYSEEDQQIHWTSAMASVAFNNTNALFSTLLAINLDWKLMQGGFFALDEVSNVVFYRFHEPASNLHTQRFLTVTDRFIERSDFWKKCLKGAIDNLPTLRS